MVKELRIGMDRLDRVEAILEKMAEKLDQLVALEVRHDNTVFRLERVEVRLGGLEERVMANHMSTKLFERVAWIVFTVIMALGTWWFT